MTLTPDYQQLFGVIIKRLTSRNDDLWMTKERYSWLQEYRPFPITAKKSASTVQDYVEMDMSVYVSADDFHFINGTQEQRDFLDKYYSRAKIGQDWAFDQVEI